MTTYNEDGVDERLLHPDFHSGKEVQPERKSPHKDRELARLIEKYPESAEELTELYKHLTDPG